MNVFVEQADPKHIHGQIFPSILSAQLLTPLLPPLLFGYFQQYPALFHTASVCVCVRLVCYPPPWMLQLCTPLSKHKLLQMKTMRIKLNQRLHTLYSGSMDGIA